MSNPNREFDKTHLSIDTAAERVMFHRDYIAHLFRWTHVIKYLYGSKRYATAKILDMGCGKEVPMGRALYSNKMSGGSYCGVDLNKLVMPDMLQKAMDNGKLDVTLMAETDVTKLTMADLPFRPNIITSFEAFEHMTPAHSRKLLENAFDFLSDDGRFFLSTPCWNGKAAANHINETKYSALGSALEDVGFHIEEHYGTFASISDYSHHLTPDQMIMFNKLREYYDTNVLSAVIAPAIDPSYARNVHWVLSKKPQVRQFVPLLDLTQPWSQHADWRDLCPE